MGCREAEEQTRPYQSVDLMLPGSESAPRVRTMAGMPARARETRQPQGSRCCVPRFMAWATTMPSDSTTCRIGILGDYRMHMGREVM